jgi:hypothetical protein
VTKLAYSLVSALRNPRLEEVRELAQQPRPMKWHRPMNPTKAYLILTSQDTYLYQRLGCGMFSIECLLDSELSVKNLFPFPVYSPFYQRSMFP